MMISSHHIVSIFMTGGTAATANRPTCGHKVPTAAALRSDYRLRPTPVVVSGSSSVVAARNGIASKPSYKLLHKHIYYYYICLCESCRCISCEGFALESLVKNKTFCTWQWRDHVDDAINIAHTQTTQSAQYEHREYSPAPHGNTT